jgi:hypothetical protein
MALATVTTLATVMELTMAMALATECLVNIEKEVICYL